MINKKNYYNNLEFISALFCLGLLNKDEIFGISNYLLNNGYDSIYLINIWLSYKDNKNEILNNNFSLFLIEQKVFISSKEEATNTLIKLIFKEVLNNKILFSDGVEFIIKNLIDDSKNKEFIGDYLGIDKIIGIHYTIDDCDLINENNIEKLKDLGIEMIKKYLNI